MWQVTYPHITGQNRKENPDYDEVYLLTRYASLEHWDATRPPELFKLGGAGPYLDRFIEGEKQRGALMIQTEMTALRGGPAFNGPYFPTPIVEPAR